MDISEEQKRVVGWVCKSLDRIADAGLTTEQLEKLNDEHGFADDIIGYDHAGMATAGILYPRIDNGRLVMVAYFNENRIEVFDVTEFKEIVAGANQSYRINALSVAEMLNRIEKALVKEDMDMEV